MPCGCVYVVITYAYDGLFQGDYKSSHLLVLFRFLFFSLHVKKPCSFQWKEEMSLEQRVSGGGWLG